MCGIIGYVGGRPCRELILTGLERLEYRGYDSAGFALMDSTQGVAEAVRAVGNLSKLRDAAGLNGTTTATTGLGHTRWATHGRVTTANAHPHTSSDGKVIVVMNGIIENYIELRTELQNMGVVFASDTDTEVIPQLLAREYMGDLAETVREVLPRLGGHFAFVAAHVDEPGRLIASRRECPLVLGVGDGERFVASAIPAFLRETRDIVLLEDDEVVVLEADATHGFRERRRGGGAPGRARGLGRGRRREGRIRDLHAQGDPRAARRPVGHDRRPPAPRRRGGTGRSRPGRRGPGARGAHPHRGLRHLVPRRPGRPVPDRGLGPHPGPRRGRLRIPLPHLPRGPGRPGDRHHAERRDRRHPRGDARGPRARRPRRGADQHHGIAGHPRRRRRALHARRARDRRGRHQDAHRAGDGPLAAGAQARAPQVGAHRRRRARSGGGAAPRPRGARGVPGLVGPRGGHAGGRDRTPTAPSSSTSGATSASRCASRAR